MWSDILFFGESGRHITVEPAGILNDMLPMATLVFTEYFWQLLGLVGFLALLLWLVVSGEGTVERALRVPLELQEFPPGL